jgi:hypothetical protein
MCVRNFENQLLVSGLARAHEYLHFAMFMSTLHGGWNGRKDTCRWLEK